MKKSAVLVLSMVALTGCMHLDERGIETKDTSRVNQPGAICTLSDENGQMRKCMENRYTRNTPTDYTTGVLENGKPVAVMNNNANKTVFVYAPVEDNCSSDEILTAEKAQSVVVSVPTLDEESTFIIEEKPVVVVPPNTELKSSSTVIVTPDAEMKVSDKQVIVVTPEESTEAVEKKWWPVSTKEEETTTTKVGNETPKNIGRPCPCEDINQPCPECFDK